MAEAKQKIVTRKLEDLQEVAFVRTALDEDYCMKLAALYESGVNPPPIEITKLQESDGTIIHDVIADGRHRKAAQMLAMRVDCECIEIPPMKRVEFLAYAASRNEGGPKPMSEKDVTWTVQQMLQLGASAKKVYDELGDTYPKAFLRRYINKAEKNIHAGQVARARRAVLNEGKSIKDAAVTFGVDVRELRVALGGNRSVDNLGIAQMKSAITSKTFQMHRFVSSMVKRLGEGVIDNTVEPEILDAVLQHVGAKLRQMVRAYEDWTHRAAAAKEHRIVDWRGNIDEDEPGAAA